MVAVFAELDVPHVTAMMGDVTGFRTRSRNDLYSMAIHKRPQNRTAEDPPARRTTATGVPQSPQLRLPRQTMFARECHRRSTPPTLNRRETRTSSSPASRPFVANPTAAPQRCHRGWANIVVITGPVISTSVVYQHNRSYLHFECVKGSGTPILLGALRSETCFTIRDGCDGAANETHE